MTNKVGKMLILENPTEESAGVAIKLNDVYHYVDERWIRCGDCKTEDDHICNLIKRYIKYGRI